MGIQDETLELVAYISESKRTYCGGGFFFGEARFSDDHFFLGGVFEKERKRLGFGE